MFDINDLEHRNFSISQEGLEELKKSEGLVLRMYKDAVGRNTIGYGHLVTTKDPEFPPKLTLQQAEDLLRKDLKRFEKTIQTRVVVPITQGQFDALVCLAYNIGVTNFRKSTLLKKLNRGDYTGAAEQFLSWRFGTIKGKKVALPGLQLRRMRERDMFLPRN